MMKSKILGAIAVVVVVASTYVVFNLCESIKTTYEAKHTVVQSSSSIINEEEEKLTPKQQEICKYKAQLMFLLSDQTRIGSINQDVLNQMKTLLQSKTSGEVKVTDEQVNNTKNAINKLWEENNHFATEDGVNIGKAYSTYLGILNTYLDGGLKTGELNVSNLPKFSADNITKLESDINETKVQLMGLGSSLDLSSPNYFTVQNRSNYNTGY